MSKTKKQSRLGELAQQISQDIVGLRAKSEKSQSMVARELGSFVSAVSRLESGRTNPTIKTLVAFADVYDHDVVVKFVPRKKR